MLKPEFTGQFKKDYKLALKRGCAPKKLEKVIQLLCSEESLPEIYRDHPLNNSRNYKGMRECHIEPNWLLIYKIVHEILILKFGLAKRQNSFLPLHRDSSNGQEKEEKLWRENSRTCQVPLQSAE